MFVGGMRGNELEQQHPGDDEGAADEMVGKNRFAEIPVREEERNDDRQITHERDGGNGQAFHGFVEAKDIEQPRNESEAQKRGDKHERERADFGEEGIIQEVGEQEECDDGDETARKERNLYIGMPQEFAENQIADGIHHTRERQQNITRVEMQSLRAAAQRQNHHSDADGRDGDSMYFGELFLENDDRQDDEEEHFGVAKQRCVHRGAGLQSYEEQQGSERAAGEPDAEQRQQCFARKPHEASQHRHESRRKENKERHEHFADEEKTQRRQCRGENFRKSAVGPGSDGAREKRAPSDGRFGRRSLLPLQKRPMTCVYLKHFLYYSILLRNGKTTI